MKAHALLIATEGFTKCVSAKQLACYCGVASFENRLGSSVRGRTGVSHLANKSLKCLSHMCALSAIQRKLRAFYERKLKKGNRKWVALNALRNKIIHRIMVCLKNEREYQENYHFSLA